MEVLSVEANEDQEPFIYLEYGISPQESCLIVHIFYFSLVKEFLLRHSPYVLGN